MKNKTINETMGLSERGNEHHFRISYQQYSYWLAITVIIISLSVGHCPVYNTVTKKIDSIVCAGENCPQEVYRSDAVYKCISQ